MKALKNESTAYIEQIEYAVTACYAKSAEPSNAELMRLYSFIGQSICAQGEKAFVVQLAEILAVRFPQVKGFSPRNLRRMRDLYRTYENRPDLMRKAQALGWTQNAVILECCEDNEHREFYIDLAIDKNLSKLSLMREIETGAFEQALRQHDDMDQSTDEMPEPVSNASDMPGIDKTPVINAECGPFVTACEPLRQGDGTPSHTRTNNLGIDGRNRAVNDIDVKPIAKLIEVILTHNSERMLGNLRSWFAQLGSTLACKRFIVGIWIGGSPPDGWRCPWKKHDWIHYPT